VFLATLLLLLLLCLPGRREMSFLLRAANRLRRCLLLRLDKVRLLRRLLSLCTQRCCGCCP
jgi:hypothetical protein